MRAVIDTNIMISALLAQRSVPGRILRSWAERKFVLLTCDRQMQELTQTLRKPELAARIVSREAGRIVNTLRRFGKFVDPLPFVQRSPDPEDDFLLAAAEAGAADYLVTGDKGGLLVLKKHGGTSIITASDFIRLVD